MAYILVPRHGHMSTYVVTRHEVWLGNWIYWTIKTRSYR
jgi:hypothetical protein